jgi:hypothetical protein
LSISPRYSLAGEEVGSRTGLDVTMKRKVVPMQVLQEPKPGTETIKIIDNMNSIQEPSDSQLGV